MSDLIERDKAMKVAMWFGTSEQKYHQSFIKKRVMEIPSARPKGEWIARIPSDSGLCTVYECPYCKYEVDCVPTNYCPNCGADMRGKDDED